LLYERPRLKKKFDKLPSTIACDTEVQSNEPRIQVNHILADSELIRGLIKFSVLKI